VNGDFFVGKFVGGVKEGEGVHQYGSKSEVMKRYSGGYRNGFFDGHGRINFTNGTSYHGEIKMGLIHGKGKFERKTGDYFEGKWKDGKFFPYGTLTYAKNFGREEKIYIGGLHRYLPNDKGKMYYINGDVYYGYWLDGKRHGKGTLTYWEMHTTYKVLKGNWEEDSMAGHCFLEMKNGDTYHGDFYDNQYNGTGVLTYACPNESNFWWKEYTGNFSNGVFSLTGKMLYSNGDLYSGEWKNGNIEGEGTLTYGVENLELKSYFGLWKANRKEGFGRLYYRCGDAYAGKFVDGVANGTAVYFFSKDNVLGYERYEGDYWNGVRSGNGVQILMDGSVYKGMFNDNHFEGYGSFESDPKSDEPIAEYTGNWSKSKKNGMGKIVLKDGETYVGNFTDD
jgi:hypothetical protein